MIKEVLANRDINTYCALCGRKFTRVASSQEHIFPKWLQHHHRLWTRRLTIPNLVGKSYKSVKIRICVFCNNVRYGKKETFISELLRSSDPYAALTATSDDDLAIWLGKIFWLLCRKSHSVEDFRTRDNHQTDRIIPKEIMPGTFYLGMLQRTFATKKGMFSCFEDDPPYPPLYGRLYSLYRFRIDTRDTRFESFGFADNIAVLGVAFRTNNIGIVCVFDGSLHRTFRSHAFAFLTNELLHPMQFGEVTGKIFFDQTVLDERACQVTYFWNEPLRSVIAMNRTSRFYDPYLEANYDPKRYALMVGRYTSSDPSTIVSEDGKGVFTSLKDHNGNFLRFAVTKEEIEAARNNPNLVSAWRPKDPPE